MDIETVFKIHIDNKDIYLSSDDFFKAIEKNKFKLDTTDIEQLMKKKIQELEELIKIIETN